MSTALITGGSRGIGKAMVEEFAAAGYAVAFTYAENSAAAEALVERLLGEGKSAAAFQADARDYERACEVVRQTRQSFGPITALVNNAGIRRDGLLHNMDPKDWLDVIGTNLTGTFNYQRAALKDMLRTGGAIVNVTSVSGITGMKGQTNYSASKAGIIGLTKSLAKEVARFGVRVNAIAPGFIETDMTTGMDEAVRNKLYAQIPMGKPGKARDVARLALYLAGEDAAYITGQVMTMDGGLS